MWITRKIRKHPVCSAISALIFVFIPSILQPWWGLFSNEPMIPAITKKLESVGMPNITFTWLYWITIPVGFGMLGYIVYLARNSKSQQVVEPLTGNQPQLQKKPYFLFIVIFVIVMGIGYPVVNGLYDTLKTEKELTPKQVESKVKDWLTDYGFSVQKLQDKEAHFCFGIVSKIGQKTIIKLPKPQETLLILYAKITPKSKDIEAINKLKKTNKTSVKIKTYLDNKDLSYTLDPQLKKIEIEEVLFVESLTQPNFFKALKRISSGQTMIATYIHEVLNP